MSDEYPEANNDELAMLARDIFADTMAYQREIDRLLRPVNIVEAPNKRAGGLN